MTKSNNVESKEETSKGECPREKGDWGESGSGGNQNMLYTCQKLSKNKINKMTFKK